MCAFSPPLPCAGEGPGLKGDRFMAILGVSSWFVLELSAHALEDLPGHDDDVYDYMTERLNPLLCESMDIILQDFYPYSQAFHPRFSLLGRLLGSC